MNGVAPRGGPPPSPPISVAARSSNGIGLYSSNGPPPLPPNGMPPPNGFPGGPPPPNGQYPPRKVPQAMIEDQLQEHHRVLKQYLIDSQREDHTYQPHNRARDKLLRLSSIQFQELSTDVYDELLRREDERRANPGAIPRFLPPKQNFHPKRNQARQKLSTLAQKKFRELSTDVLFELERRFPRFLTGEPRSASPSGSNRTLSMRSMSVRSGPGRMPPPPLGLPPNGLPRAPGDMPTPSPGPYSPAIFDNSRKQFQSNTAVPNKGIMVEDDDDDDDDFASRSSRRTTNKSLTGLGDHGLVSDLQAQITDLQQKLEQKDSQSRELEQELQTERAKATDLSSDLEKQLKSAEALNSSLQMEVETLRAQNSEHSAGDEWRDRYQTLEKEFHEQQLLTDEVRQEAIEHLQEMRSIASRANQAADREMALTKKVATLEAAVEEWKSKFVQSKSQIRSLRATSMSLKSESSSSSSNNLRDAASSFINPHGLITSAAITNFQVCVDELLHIARGDAPSSTLQYMRTMVASVRAVTADIESPSLPPGELSTKALDKLGLDDDSKRRVKLKMRVSAAANNLITTSNTFASSNGLAPVSLVDAAATHLVAAVVELCKAAGVRPAADASNDVHHQYNGQHTMVADDDDDDEMDEFR